MAPASRLINVFTPSVADETDTNAQNLTVKEVVARLDPELFHVTMLREQSSDPRIAGRKNTTVLPYYAHGNTPRLTLRLLADRPDIYFFPRYGPLDRAFLSLRKHGLLKTALVTYVVMMMNKETSSGTITRLIREADAVYGNSTFVSETVREQFGVCPAGEVYDGVDRRFFFPPSAAKAAGEKTIVLYAGTFQARKRVEVVIEQAQRWPQVEFRLAGKGVTETACRDMVQQRGCGNVVFLGHLVPSQLGEEMRGADVFLFPSVVEGHPQVLIQAAACGLPAVAMSVYRPDAIAHGRTGFLADKDQQLAESVDSLLRDVDLRRRMSVAAAQHAQRFDWDRIAKQWSDIFREVAARQENRNHPSAAH
jgi:glycosyltransferase involved in cell wall biosynthesis